MVSIRRIRALLLLLCAAPLLVLAGELVPDPPIRCDACEGWNTPHEPFHVFGNTFYVGTSQLGSILVVTDAGLVLIDGALPQSAPGIATSVATLGYKLDDVKLILNSHTHNDHAGGLAALQRASGAVVAASPRSAAALRDGHPTPDDPQFAVPHAAFPPLANLREIGDGERLAVGSTAFTAHFTPGHTPGSTTWTWTACEDQRCLAVVYADSLNAVSADGFRFTGGGDRPSLAESFRRSIDIVSRLPCDILLAPHPGFAQLEQKFERSKGGESDAFVDPAACRHYAAGASLRLEKRLHEEQP
ncbi:MAG: subclass B3 metallo-beta-lactamase [Gammaproteobacteria bacterium]